MHWVARWGSSCRTRRRTPKSNGAAVARKPYRLARQQHVGDALDDLQARGLLRWRWSYVDSSAIFRVAEADGTERPLATRRAEQVVQRHYDQLEVPWVPVAHPGGEVQLEAAVKEIARRRGQA